MIAGFAILLSLSQTGLPGAQLDIREVVLAGDMAYVLRPAEVIAQSVVRQIEWSSDGQFLLFTRVEPVSPTAFLNSLLGLAPVPPTQVSVNSWNAKTKATRTLWRGSGEMPTLFTSWLAGTHTAVISFVDAAPGGRGVHHLVRLHVDSGQSQHIHSTDVDMARTVIWASPKLPIALVQYHTGTPEGGYDRLFIVVPATGPTVGPIRLDTLGETPILFDKQGVPFTQTYIRDLSKREMKGKDIFYSISPTTGKVTVLDKKPEAETGSRADLIKAEVLTHTLTAGPTKHRAHSLWLVAPKSDKYAMALVSGDCLYGALSPNQTAIAFVSGGIAAVRPVIKTPRAEIEERLDAAERTRLVRNGKEIGLAALLYAGDHNDVLPPPGATTELFEPYAKSLGLFEGFVYSFPGGPLADVQAVAETILGYIPGPGGRVVIYVDGHSKWVKNP